MKTVSNDLFELIHSLGKQEKRYFKRFASRHVIGDRNKYVELFDAIASQGSYDEKKIREKFRGAPFLRQLHVAKNYLYKLILDSLRNFHESNREDRFNTMIRHAELLFDKGLYKQSQKILGKAKKKAIEKEQFLQILEVYRWEHHFTHSRNDFDELEHYVEHGIQEEFRLLEKYRNFLEFQALNDRVFIPYWKKGTIRKKSEKEALENLFKDPLFQGPENAQSFIARYFFHNARFSYYFILNELEGSYRHISEMVKMFEGLQEKQLKGRLGRFYGSVLINQYVVQRGLQDFESIPPTLDRLRNLPASSPEHKMRLFIRSFNLELDFHLSTGHFQKGIQRISHLIATFNRYEKKVSEQQQLGIYYNLAYLYFGAGIYDKALDWINRLLNSPALKTREDIHCFGRLLNLIIHYELGNDQLLEYIVKATTRFLSSRKRLFKVESIMLKLMRQYPDWVSKKEKESGFSSLILELQTLQEDEFEQRAFEYFDFIAWMQSKTSSKSFASIIIKKNSPTPQNEGAGE